VAPLERLAPGTRRRARFSIGRRRGAVQVGFNARASHRIADLRLCPVLHPALAALLAPLHTLAQTLWPDGTAGAATATVSETGVDLLLDLPRTPDLAALEVLARFAAERKLARLQWRAPGSGEATPVAQHSPRMTFAGIAVTPPADAFLQASVEADQVL